MANTIIIIIIIIGVGTVGHGPRNDSDKVMEE